MIDPKDYIISRKRKKYKFAKFANSELCFEANEWAKKPIDILEVGAGTGLFLVELATRHPVLQFAAIDVKADRLQKGAYEAQERHLDNIMFIRSHATQLQELFGPHALAQVWLTFSDPFPRKRDAKRRLTSQRYLDIYQQLLKNDGTLLIKTDDHAFFDWSLEELVRYGWQINELSYDLHASELDDEYRYKTTYETRWLEEGRVTYFAKARTPIKKEAL